jgi:hypothetical protein
MSPPAGARPTGRRQFLLVASLFIVPLATAIVLYYSSAWRPVVNSQGNLLDPPRPVAVAGAALADGRPAPADVFEGRWSLVHPAAACDERTEAVLDELARVRLALDKDAMRVRRVLAHSGACPGAATGPRDADLLVLAGDAAFLAQFPPAVDGRTGIYIVDPHGNLLMSYPASGSARGLLKDMERLLRLSGIG